MGDAQVSLAKAIETLYGLISCARFVIMLLATYKNYLHEKGDWATVHAAKYEPVPFQSILVDCHSSGEGRWNMIPHTALKLHL